MYAINYFNRKKIVYHDKFSLMMNDLLQFIQTAPEGSLALVMGPTGVGKTTLLNELYAESNKWINANPDIFPNKSPIASIQVPSPDSGNFDWRDCYTKILQEFNEPLIDKKKIVNHDLKAIQDSLGLTVRQRTAPALRIAVDNCLKYRKPVAIFLDEAQHLIKISSGRRLQDQLDTIKALANETGAIFILFGTYELLKLTNLSGQLARRTEVFHFSRYAHNLATDYEAFIDLAHAIFQLSPIPVSIDPVNSAEYLYTCSIGCGGILKKWIGKAINNAFASGDDKLLLKHLKKTQLEQQALSRIAIETIEGEIFSKKSDLSAIQKILGFKFEAPKVVTNQKTRKQPGRRDPVRDPVEAFI